MDEPRRPRREVDGVEALFDTIFDRAPIGILLADTTRAQWGQLLRVNEALCRITGYSRDQLLQMSVADLTHPEHRTAHRENFGLLSSGTGGRSEVQRRWVSADGRDLWVQLTLSVALAGPIQCHICLVEDVTNREQNKQRLQFLARHDPLTGLANRLVLVDRLERALDAPATGPIALVHLNIDDFKTVNDRGGHQAGDELLAGVARRLADHVRPEDTVARLGGDEFVVIFTELTDATDVASVARRLVDVVRAPFDVGPTAIRVTVSGGVSVSRDGASAQEMLREADDAMRTAKAAGKDAIRVNAGAEHVRNGYQRRRTRIDTELRHALDNDELVMHGQPVLDLQTGNIVAVEMLVRWAHPTRGIVGPLQFLPDAEASHLMSQVGSRILAESCRIAADWTAPPGVAPPDVYVNISGGELAAGQLPRVVLDALSLSGLPATRLVLELTESLTPLIGGSLLKDLNALHDLGVRFALDDVGTGYSSLTRLTEIPVIDVLKIDRAFIGDVGNPTCAAVVRAILSIGEALHLGVIAEGVETEEQASALRGYHCPSVQGFLYSTARPEDDLHQLIREPPHAWQPLFPGAP